MVSNPRFLNPVPLQYPVICKDRPLNQSFPLYQALTALCNVTYLESKDNDLLQSFCSREPVSLFLEAVQCQEKVVEGRFLRTGKVVKSCSLTVLLRCLTIPEMKWYPDFVIYSPLEIFRVCKIFLHLTIIRN